MLMGVQCLDVPGDATTEIEDLHAPASAQGLYILVQMHREPIKTHNRVLRISALQNVSFL